MSTVNVKVTPRAGLTVVVEKLEIGLVGMLDAALLITCEIRASRTEHARSSSTLMSRSARRPPPGPLPWQHDLRVRYAPARWSTLSCGAHEGISE